MQLKDSEGTYGTVSRFLHWSMALLIAWQFASAGARVLFEDTALDEFLWATHKPLGLLLLVMVLLRAAWSLFNAGHRPRSLSIMARLGHLALYTLVVVVPLLALLRQYGSGRAFSPFGLPLMAGFEGDGIEWLTTPGNVLHGWLGWLLLVLILGHILMTILHRRRSQDEDVMARMLGSRR